MCASTCYIYSPYTNMAFFLFLREIGLKHCEQIRYMGFFPQMCVFRMARMNNYLEYKWFFSPESNQKGFDFYERINTIVKTNYYFWELIYMHKAI